MSLVVDFFAAWGAALGFVVAGALVGVLGRRLLVRKLGDLAHRTRTRLDDLAFEALGGLWLWVALLGALVPAARFSPLAPEQSAVFERGAVAALLLLVTLGAARFVGLWLAGAQRADGEPPGRPTLVSNVARGAVLLAGGLLVLDNAGVEITTLLTALGVGSLAVGLALQPTLSNVFAGLHLSMAKPIRVGDFVELEDGTQGVVMDIGWRTTRLLQPANHLVVVPNERLSDMRLLNYTLPDPRHSLTVGIAVAYGSDLRRAERIGVEVAREVLRELPEGDAEFEPSLRFHGFGESAILGTVTLRVRDVRDRAPVVHEYLVRLEQRFAAQGIELPAPRQWVALQPAGQPESRGARRGERSA